MNAPAKDKVEEIARIVDPIAFDIQPSSIGSDMEQGWRQRCQHAEAKARAILSAISPSARDEALEEAMRAMPCTASNPNENEYERGRFDAVMEYQKNIRALKRTTPAPRSDFIDIVLDGPPGHESGRFVEVENAKGASVSVGEWLDRGNGLWALRIPLPAPRSGEWVSVPRKALDWLHGEAPDHEGRWFGEVSDSVRQNLGNRRAPHFWWRSHFRKIREHYDAALPAAPSASAGKTEGVDNV